MSAVMNADLLVEECQITRRIVDFGKAQYAVVERVSTIEGRKVTEICTHKLNIPWLKMEGHLDGPMVEAQ